MNKEEVNKSIKELPKFLWFYIKSFFQFNMKLKPKDMYFFFVFVMVLEILFKVYKWITITFIITLLCHIWYTWRVGKWRQNKQEGDEELEDV